MRKLRQFRQFGLAIVLLICTVGPLSAQERVTIALWGDSRENLDNACVEIAGILLHKVTDWDIQVHTGDFTHAGREEDWERTLQYPGISELFVKGRILMCTSNHDAGNEGAQSDKRTVWDQHTAGVLPVNDFDHTTHFSAWHKGNVEVLCCDAYLTDSTTMTRWLDRELAAVRPDDWVVAVWHEPAYGLTYKEPYLPVCRPWLERLIWHKGVFVLNGHAHLYLRTRPLSVDGSLDPDGGIVHVINGTGGASWKDPVRSDPRIAFSPSTRSFPCITFITFQADTASVHTMDARPGSHLATIDEWRWVR